MSEREQQRDEMHDDPSKKRDTQREIPRGTDEHAKDSTVAARESDAASDTRDGSDNSTVEKPAR